MRKRKHSTVSRCIMCSLDLISPATLPAGLGRAGRADPFYADDRSAEAYAGK